MDPTVKRQKINDCHECALLGIKITPESSVTVGKENIWAPMVLVFSTYFDFFSSSLPVTEAMLSEAREKSMTVSQDIQEFLMTLIKSGEKIEEETTRADLNIQYFWLLFMEQLHSELLEHLKLDHPKALVSQILKVIYLGTLQLHCYLPEEGLHMINSLSRKIDELLMGEEFWAYNPILLTQSHIWCHALLDDLMEDHTRHVKRSHIAHSFSLATLQHPFPELRALSEAQVCDQQLAVRMARGDLGSTLDDGFSDEEGNVPSLWNVGTNNIINVINNSMYILPNY